MVNPFNTNDENVATLLYCNLKPSTSISKVLVSRVGASRACRSRRMSQSIKPADRIAGTTPSVWVEFTALAREAGAINVGQGFPDYASTPSHVTDTLAKVTAGADNVLMNQYTRGYGHPLLVGQLGSLYSKLLGRSVDPSNEVLITVGAYHALFYSAFGFLNPGDEAIIMEPYYDCYEPQVRMAGATPVFVPLRFEQSEKSEASSSDMKLDFAELEAAFSSKTKLLYLNNPHNPSGKLFTRDELTKIAELAEKYNFIVLADEVYEWLVYKPNEMVRFASLPGMWNRTITIGSAGKTFSVTGWKMGWAIAPNHLLEPLRNVHQNCVYTCPTTVQEAVGESFQTEIAKLGTDTSYFETLSEELRPKRDRLVEILRRAGMNPVVPESGYFMMAQCDKLVSKMGPPENPNEPKDYQFVRWLTKEKKLAGIPPSAFYSPKSKKLGDGWIRFCFFKKDATLDGAEKILKAWVEE